MSVATGWKILVVLAVFAQLFVTAGPLYNYNVFFVRFQDEFQTSAAVTGWLGSLSSSLLCASSPLAAVIGSKIGNLRLSVLGVVLALSGFMSSSFITSLGHGYLTLGIMAGLGAGFAHFAAGSLLLDWYSDQPENCRATGSALLGSSVGVMVFGPVLNTLNASCGWRNSFRILSGVMLLVGLASALTFWKCNKVRQSSQNEEEKAAREKTSSHYTKEMIDGSSSTKGKKDSITPEDERATLTTVNSFNDPETIPEWKEVTVILENETVIKKTAQNGEDKIPKESDVSEGEKETTRRNDETVIHKTLSYDGDKTISEESDTSEGKENTISQDDEEAPKETSSNCSKQPLVGSDSSKWKKVAIGQDDETAIKKSSSYEREKTFKVYDNSDGEKDIISQEDETASEEISSNVCEKIFAGPFASDRNKDATGLSRVATTRKCSSKDLVENTSGACWFDASDYRKEISDSKFRVLLDVEVWLWVMNITFAQIGWSFVIVNYSSFMERNELSTEQISFVLTVFGAAEVAGKIAFAMFGDRLPCLKMYVTVTSSFCGAVVSAFLTLCSTFQQMMCLSVDR
ncbi:uncharacterized protein LOC119728073 [Patiria miniata]|uniref:Uncharacterized protein n=1 Tax=Patiria miniata TaxID=46514 RepID=A0A913ZXN5_PATMI|nr:uncharacterized protein LOC119728073 [Patiria miniata]